MLILNKIDALNLNDSFDCKKRVQLLKSFEHFEHKKYIREQLFFANRRILGSTIVVNKISRFRKRFKFIDFVGFNI